MKDKQSHGQWGEDMASGFLQKLGWTILERNWRYKHTEVDLIARDGKVLVFVEVKARSTAAFGRPEEMVGPAKKQALIAAAGDYLYRHFHEGEFRFDIIAVTGNRPETAQIRHFRDAFYP
jgi:putative endonuclease